MNSQVSDLVQGLKSRHAETRRRSIRELYLYAKTELREMPPETLTRVLDDFNQQIHSMISSYDVNEKKAGILTIVCLIGGDNETTKTRTMRYANYLKNVFPSSDIGILELAAKTMGRLAMTLGPKQAEYVETEIKRALEWLAEDRNEGKRLSAVLILKEMAISTPSIFYLQIYSFFNYILLALRDPKELVREAAGNALRAAFVVTTQRENPKHANRAIWYIQCYEDATTSFCDLTIREKGLSRDDHVHGALLILNELLRCSNSVWERKYVVLMHKLDAHPDTSDEISSLNDKGQRSMTYPHFTEDGSNSNLVNESAICKQLITEKYEKICSDVMAQQISRSPHIHQVLLLMIPRLAAFNREVYSKRHLKSTINHLITFIRGREKEKAMAFVTLGLIAVAVDDDITPYLSRIIDIIKMSFPQMSTPKKKQTSDAALFNCITLLGSSMKEDIGKELKELLEPMCATGLSLHLTTCFKELSKNIPTLRKDITNGLLNMLSIVLRKKAYVPSGNLNSSDSQLAQIVLSVEPYDATKLVLALRTLGSFDFEWQHILMSFIRRCTDHYLQSEQHEVRLEAVRTTSKLLVKAAEKAAQNQSKTLHTMIDVALSKLLSTGLSDFNSEVRFWVFEIFSDPIFDMYLAQEEHLSTLFIAINDESIEVREQSMCIIGRLSTINPSYVSPSLRQMYVQYLLEMQHSGLARNKEQATRMINNLILYAPTMTRPYVDTILNVLIPKLREEGSSTSVIICILKAIGDLSEVNGDGTTLSRWLPELISISIDIISDVNSTEKRSVALWCFGQLIAATGYVVSPYMEYPELMDILLNFLKTEQQVRDRRETIRVLGLLGALDPYKHKVNRGLIDFQTSSILIPYTEDPTNAYENMDTLQSEMLINIAPLVLDEFYPAIVMTSLMRILRDNSLSQHHTSVVHSVTFIFQTLGTKCFPYISRVVPSLLYVIRNTENKNFREFLFTQLAQLISIVKIHIRKYLGKIFDIICEYWTPKSELQPTLVMLIDQIAVAIGIEFKIYLPKILPHILRVLNNDTSHDKFVTEKVLLAIQKFDNNIDDVLQLIVPAVTKLFDSRDVPSSIAKLAMETIENLCLTVNLKPFSNRIIHPLVRVLESSPNLRSTAMNTLCALIIQIGRDYNHFIPAVDKVLQKHKIHCQNYIVLVSRLEFPTTMACEDNYLQETRIRLRTKTQDVVSAAGETIQKLSVNAGVLRKCWALEGRVSKDDWLDWLRRLSVGLLSESHSPAIRACSTLALNYPPLTSELFNAAFMSCWTELDEHSRKDQVTALEVALKTSETTEVVMAILDLAEFMEHCEKGSLPIPLKLLGDCAVSCRMYAKALYYKEEEYKINPTSQIVEALIHINKKLQQKEAANGLLETVIKQRKYGDTSLNVHVQWYEKLHNWNQALDLYDKKLELEPQDDEATFGQLRCLEALGEWDKIQSITTDKWDGMPEDVKKRSAKIAAAACWETQEWESMQRYVEFIPENSQDGAFYRAILAIHSSQWAESRHFVDLARYLLDAELSAVAGESYQRAYAALVQAQLLVELEEVVTYKLIEERRPVIRQAWWLRLQGGERVLEDWRKILQIRSLVVSPREDFITWLKFASLCRKSGVLSQAHNVLNNIIGFDLNSNHELLFQINEPRVILNHTKNLWVGGDKRLAYDLMQRFVEIPGTGDEEHCRLLARCHLKLGSWCEQLQGINEISIPDILRNYETATVLAPDWYKAWHAWAYVNFETVLFYKQQDNNSESSMTNSSGDKKISRPDILHQYIIASIEGFLKSINLSKENSLQNTLRLLTLWFDYGHHTPIYEVLFDGIRKIEINTWLQVIPQLIARIDSPRPLVAKLVHSLLIDIGKWHPQALVYPLTVASKSSFVARKTAANQILKTMCSHSQNLVTQAAIISEELIRVAILWHDQWYIALDEASRIYYNNKDIKGMFKTLEPLHAMLERGPQTLKEHSFVQMYGRDLKEAQEWCNRYKETGYDTYLNQAWDLYYHVFRRIASQFRSLNSLELQYVSTRLLNCRDLELAVPGSYAPHQELIKIASIDSNLQVINSKQRPRRLTIHGSDGKDYMFLLKGHEDLRQDERVMQMFGLVNTLLKSDRNTYRHDLAILRYAVVPLSTNSGLIGWVPQCDTLYNLVSDYREKKSIKISLNTEQQLMLKMTSDLPKLMLMQRVEVFEQTLSQTPGNDLARLLWLKSPSAEAWFERRNNYTRSLAVMSMVGYILGLGDRHPSNIMLHRVTGKVLHIDFGDCFEVTLTRDKYPEKIPFRLTRMLVNAMEVTGIEGTYRSTCESVMEVLHKHKDSVMAVLEAFVYDPLLNWRLVETGRHSMSDTSLGSSEPGSPSSLPSRSRHHLHMTESIEAPVEVNQNKRALTVVNRIRDKLTGRDFPRVKETVSVQKQVDLLIQQATSNENLCQCYIGWCPFW